MATTRTVLFALLGVLLAVTVAAPSVADDVAAPEALFENAESLYRQLRAVDPTCENPEAWHALADAFGEIPRAHPSSPLAGAALWRLGDIHSRRLAAGISGAAPAARAAYAGLVDSYPSSAFAPEAYLRLAELSGMAERAERYRQLQERYPDSPEAGEARRRLSSPAPATAAATPPPAAEPSGGVSPGFIATGTPVDEVLEAPPTPASSTSSALDNELVTQPAAFGRVTGVRHYSDAKHTRVVFDLDAELEYELGEAQDPPRLFIDLIGAELPAELLRDQRVDGTGVERIRMGVNRPGIVRAVLDLRGETRYSLFRLADPSRIVIDVPSPAMAERLAHARRPPAPEGGAEARQLALGVHRIVIDPGHGGTAPGAIGRSGVMEKQLTLDISKRLAENLRRSGFDVVLTREDDDSIDLERRPLMATELEADLFVSVHINSSNNRKLSGFETYYLDLATDPTAAETAARENASATQGMGHLDGLLDEIVKNANKRESRDLAQSIQDSLVLQMSKHHDDIRDLGVKHAPFVVLVGADMPAVLVECSFLSHRDEEERLRDPEYRQRVADSIHIGIENFVARRRMLTQAQ